MSELADASGKSAVDVLPLSPNDHGQVVPQSQSSAPAAAHSKARAQRPGAGAAAPAVNWRLGDWGPDVCRGDGVCGAFGDGDGDG